jgi:hypothetical protein
LEEDFRVGAHLHAFYSGLFPSWEGGGEVYDVVLEDAETEGADCVVGLDATPISVGDGYARVGVGD